MKNQQIKNENRKKIILKNIQYLCEHCQMGNCVECGYKEIKEWLHVFSFGKLPEIVYDACKDRNLTHYMKGVNYITQGNKVNVFIGKKFPGSIYRGLKVLK